MGEDIPNAEMLFLKLKKQKSVVELFFVSENSVEAKVDEMQQVSADFITLLNILICIWHLIQHEII